MNPLLSPTVWALSVFLGTIPKNTAHSIKEIDTLQIVKSSNHTPKIQAAILLDVSNSMDGLIDQTKNQLWNMVGVLGRVKCNGALPQIEIALYEYGRPANNPKEGYVKKISAFTNDLDKVFSDLVGLTTNGGDEYCGHVIYSSVTELNWDTSAASYKVIFIAGNESFLQGDISFTKACQEAKTKGVIVNTIYCGNKDAGIREYWNLGAECGNGSFTNIDQDAKEFTVPTPYDDSLITLKTKLNETYIAYGENGISHLRSMAQSDSVARTSLNDPSKVVEYIVTKSNKGLFSFPDWDLVDALEKDSTIINKVEMKTLEDSLKKKDRQELKKIVETRATERRLIQRKIEDLRLKQEAFVATEKMKANINDPQTLRSEIDRIIKEQVKRFNMIIK